MPEMGGNGVGFCGVTLAALKCPGEVRDQASFSSGAELRVGPPCSGAGRQQDAVSEQGGSPVNSQFIENQEPAQPRLLGGVPSAAAPHKTPGLPAANKGRVYGGHPEVPSTRSTTSPSPEESPAG